LHAAPVISPAELAHIAVQVPGTELVIVADDGPLKRGKGVLHSLCRCPDPVGQFLTVVSSGMFLFGDEAQVCGISVGDHLFGVLGEFGIQHRLDGLEAG